MLNFTIKSTECVEKLLLDNSCLFIIEAKMKNIRITKTKSVKTKSLQQNLCESKTESITHISYAQQTAKDKNI